MAAHTYGARLAQSARAEGFGRARARTRDPGLREGAGSGLVPVWVERRAAADRQQATLSSLAARRQHKETLENYLLCEGQEAPATRCGNCSAESSPRIDPGKGGGGASGGLSNHSVGEALPLANPPLWSCAGVRESVHTRNLIYVRKAGIPCGGPVWSDQPGCQEDSGHWRGASKTSQDTSDEHGTVAGDWRI